MEWVWRDDICWWNTECYNLGVKVIYDEKTLTIKCPRCGGTETLPEEWWRDRQTLRRTLYEYMPGKYLFKNLPSEEIASLFIRKLSKKRWINYLAHDYVLAKLRRDPDAQNRMKEAMRAMALKMEYDVEECMTMFPMLDDLEKSCDHVPYMIFDIARENFRVEGWRKREDEIVREGHERGLYAKRTREGELYSRESRLWGGPTGGYESALRGMYFVFRANGDRVACWVTRELLRKVDYMIHGDGQTFRDIELDPFPDGLIEDVLNGREDTRDVRELTVQWFLDLAEDEISNEDYLTSSGAADDAVLAVATRLGWKTVPDPCPNSDYVRELAERLRDPEVLRLYEAATNFYDLTEVERMDAARTLLARVKGILAVLPSDREKEKIAKYVS
jgi:hypothetical protein